MKNTKILGRIEECERLDGCMQADSAQLIIVYGRRRVGKTFLINQYYNNDFAYKLTGSYNESRTNQLRNFVDELNRKTAQKYEVPRDWIEAFQFLRDYIESLPTEKKQVVFFDEMPWLDTPKSGFLPAFEYFWNGWASARDNLVFIVCGSATTWMDDKLANNKGGLFNRQTCKLYLKPFKLYEVEEYLVQRGIEWARYDIAEIYMILGGIPYYLSLLKPKLSCKQNIDALIFNKNGELRDEFYHLYNTLFTSSELYIKVVEALSKKRGGLTRSEIAKATKIPENGKLSKILKNLSLSGFIRISNFYGNKKKESVFQLADYYSTFYFKFIHNKYGLDENFWSGATETPLINSWAGLTFEQLCLDHIQQIKKKLSIGGVISTQSTWRTDGDEDLGIDGAQIDLLIERKDRVVNICEIKHTDGEFIIDKKYDINLRNKMQSFKVLTNCKKTLHLTMISPYGVKNNKYSGIVTNEVILEDLFEK